MKRQIPKNFFVFRIIPSEFVALYCLYQGRIVAIGTQCVKETVLRFCISLILTFCRTIKYPVINKYGKGAVLQI